MRAFVLSDANRRAALRARKSVVEDIERSLNLFFGRHVGYSYRSASAG